MSELKHLYRRTYNRLFGMRPMIKYIYDHCTFEPLVGAEIGIDIGVNAKNILTHLPMSLLCLVDPFERYPSHKKKALRRLDKAGGNYLFFHATSVDVAKRLPGAFLDFVYVDAGHKYDDVKSDINAWYPKVKPGGVFGGHDFKARHMGLCRAVFEFALKNNLVVYGKEWDWWVIKK